MANSWLRLWHDMPNDPKWRTIARVSKQSISAVMAVYLHVLVSASNATERGRTQDVCNEDIASALDLECEQVDAIIDAMQGRVLDGDKVSGWAKRQVEREDGSAARAKAWREAQKEAKKTKPNAPERKQTPDTDTDTDTDKKEELHGAQAPAASDADSPAEPAPVDPLPCPVQKIVEAYHTLMPDNPRIKLLDDGRRRTIAARWKQAAREKVGPFGYSTADQGVEAWKNFFEVCSESDFLTGKAEAGPGRTKPFIADLDFLLSPKGFKGCLENKYHRGVE